MYPFKTIEIRSYEKGLKFCNNEFLGLVQPGEYRLFLPTLREDIQIVSTREPWLKHAQLDLIVNSGALKNEALVVDLKDNQRALVWLNGRFNTILGPGLYALWNTFCRVEVETVCVDKVCFEHEQLGQLLKNVSASLFWDVTIVPSGYQGLFYENGTFVKIVESGRYAFWRDAADYNLVCVDCRECISDVGGQEIMTSDKVTLRVNAIVTYAVSDVKLAVNKVADFKQSLYKEAQLALRAVIGTKSLDALLENKDEVILELKQLLQARVCAFGLAVSGFGIKDVILPGDMKALLNKVTSAKKAAEASIITRREETAAMRSQANTAKLLEANPMLMKLKELEAVEKIAATGNLNVVLGDKGLTKNLVNLL